MCESRVVGQSQVPATQRTVPTMISNTINRIVAVIGRRPRLREGNGIVKCDWTMHPDSGRTKSWARTHTHTHTYIHTRTHNNKPASSLGTSGLADAAVGEQIHRQPTRMRVCVYAWMCLCMCMCMYVCMYVCMRVRMCMCMCVCEGGGNRTDPPSTVPTTPLATTIAPKMKSELDCEKHCTQGVDG